jgi:hypothetical protein
MQCGLCGAVARKHLTAVLFGNTAFMLYCREAAAAAATRLELHAPTLHVHNLA